MRRKIATMMAVVALGGLGMAARNAAAAEQPASPAAQQAQKKELKGKILSVHEKTLWIEGENGEAVPLVVSHETMLMGQRLKRDQRIESHLRKEFQQGEEVRASFEIKREREGKIENIAVSVGKEKE